MNTPHDPELSAIAARIADQFASIPAVPTVRSLDELGPIPPYREAVENVALVVGFAAFLTGWFCT